MNEYEYTAVVRLIVAAHCQADAEEAAKDALSEVVIGVDDLQLVSRPDLRTV